MQHCALNYSEVIGVNLPYTSWNYNKSSQFKLVWRDTFGPLGILGVNCEWNKIGLGKLDFV